MSVYTLMTDKEKKAKVERMFDSISSKYDLLNHLLSLRTDIWWRRQAITALADSRPQSILDVATGTGDFAIEALRLQPKEIIGIDISKGMLDEGRKKLAKRNIKNISLQWGDAENIPFESNRFDVAMVAFGARNFENLWLGLEEIRRVLKPGGRLVVLEFSQPTATPFNQLYNLYFHRVLPKVGKWISKDSMAYDYLPQSVAAFPYGDVFLKILRDIGYQNTSCKPLTFGISSLYTASK